MQDFLCALYSELKNIFITGNQYEIIVQDEHELYKQLIVNLNNKERTDTTRFLSDILPIIKKYNITSFSYKSNTLQQLIKICKTQNFTTENEYIAISLYRIYRYDFSLKGDEDYSNYPQKSLYKTFLFYNDKKIYVKSGENSKFYPCYVRDVLWFPSELQALIFKHFSSDSLFYKDVLREKFDAPIKIDDLNTYHTKKEYLEKLFKVQLPTAINKKDLFESYSFCCALKYIKSEQTDYLFSLSEIVDYKYSPTLRKRKIIAKNVISSLLKSRNPTLNKDVINDYINYSMELKQPIDILAGKRKIQHYHDELTDRMIKKSLHGKKLVIPETPLKYLKLSKDFRLLNSKKALITEGMINHNCVGGYVDRVNKGSCIIYSADINGEHLTIEIKYKKSRKKDIPYTFYVAQCYKAYNIECSQETYNYVLSSVENASMKAIEKFLTNKTGMK